MRAKWRCPRKRCIRARHAGEPMACMSAERAREDAAAHSTQRGPYPILYVGGRDAVLLRDYPYRDRVSAVRRRRRDRA